MNVSYAKVTNRLMLANPASIPVAVAGVAYYVVVDVIIKNVIEK